MTLYDSLAAPTRDHLVGIGPAVAGLVVVFILIGAVAVGLRRKNRRSAPVPPEQQPHAPEHPTGYETGLRADDEVPHDGRRRLPHEFDQVRGTRPSDQKEPPKWQEGHSGSFGNG